MEEHRFLCQRNKIKIIFMQMQNEIFQMNNTFYMIQITISNRIEFIKIVIHNAFYIIYGHICVQPYDIRLMRHNRAYLQIAQKKYPLHDILLNRLHLTVFGPLFNNRLDFFFCHLIILLFYSKKIEDNLSAFC